MKYAFGWLVVAAACLTACSRSNNLLLGEVQAQVGGHLVRVTDCYRTSVSPPEQTAGPDGRPSYRFMPCKDADVQISAGQLAVNGRGYGPIGDTDAVLVDHGVVSVKASKRPAQ